MAMAFPRWTNGASIVPWKEGRALVWDVTCPDTLAHSYQQISVREAGSVAAEAELLNSITIILMNTQLSPTLYMLITFYIHTVYNKDIIIYI